MFDIYLIAMNLLVNGVNIKKYNKTHKFVTLPYLNPYFYHIIKILHQQL